jgi:hypothetical protein
MDLHPPPIDRTRIISTSVDVIDIGEEMDDDRRGG